MSQFKKIAVDSPQRSFLKSMFIGSVLIYILKKWTRKRKATWCCSKCNKSVPRSSYCTDLVPFAKVRTVSKYKHLSIDSVYSCMRNVSIRCKNGSAKSSFWKTQLHIAKNEFSSSDNDNHFTISPVLTKQLYYQIYTNILSNIFVFW